MASNEMTTQALFAEDSDSDSDSDLEPTTNPPPTTTEQEDEEKEDEDAPHATTTTTTDKKSSDNDSDDDSDSDAEFDDSNAQITGSAATTAYKKQSSQSGTDRAFADVHGDDDDDDDDDAGEGESAQPRIKREENQERPSLPPKSMEVLAIPRPFCNNDGDDDDDDEDDPSLHMTKLPNVIGINPEAFDRNTHDALEEEEQYGTLMTNMIRWRYQKNGSGSNSNTNKASSLNRHHDKSLVRESNTRIVKWSDGSMNIFIGNEMFDLEDAAKKESDKKKPMPKKADGNKWGYLYLSQKAKHIPQEGSDIAVDGGKALTVLECMGSITSKITAKPSSLQSNAHKNLTLAVRQRNMKKARIAEYTTTMDPEKQKQDRIQMKDDIAKNEASNKRGSYGRGGKGSRRPGMNRSYLEDDNDRNYDSVNVNRLKRRNADDDFLDYGEDISDAEDNWTRKKTEDFKQQRRTGRAKEESSSESDNKDDNEDEGMFKEDSSDEETFMQKKKKSTGPVKRAGVFDDSDDSDDSDD